MYNIISRHAINNSNDGIRYLFMFSWRNVDSGPGVISRSFFIAVRNAASSLPFQGILISSSESAFSSNVMLLWMQIPKIMLIRILSLQL